MKFREATVWSLEESEQLDQITDRAPSYDIAVYSSAEWARNRFYWREKNPEKLRTYANTSEFVYKVFDEVVLDSVLELKRTHDLKVVLYPHPYERELKRKHGIDPPYLAKLDAGGIAFDESGRNSIDWIYKAKVAVAECSTIIMDRWHLGLPALTYSGLNHPGEFAVDYNYKYLGSYQQSCYTTPEELKSRLLLQLQAAS
jgi:hypothetical protein